MTLEQRVRVGAHEIAVRQDGAPDGEPLLLLMGLGLQLIAWPQGLVDRWVAAGFRVILLDHRDIGRSSPLDHLPTPPLAWAGLRQALGRPLPSPYTLADLADDAVGVLDALGVPQAQVLGISMGGMVAQHLAWRHPGRVRALHLWMTSSGARHLPLPAPRLRWMILRRPRHRDQALAHITALYQALAGPAYPTPVDVIRARVEASAERAGRPQAHVRQMMAIAHDGDRSRWLRELPQRCSAPISIVHGSADPLLPLPPGQHLANLLPAARLTGSAGWGHDLPAALWPRLAATVPRA
ncbi:MAG: alpha/beta fold hydrolase [Inhella sp.]